MFSHPDRNPLTYSERISFMLAVLAKLDDSAEKKSLLEQLIKLRKYSDVAQIVSNPKNPKMGHSDPGFAESALKDPSLAKEKTQLKEFRNLFSETQQQFVTLCQKNGYNIEYNAVRDIFDGFTTVQSADDFLKGSPKAGNR